MYMSAFGENDQENDSRNVSSGPSRCWKWKIWLPTPFLVGWNSQVVFLTSLSQTLSVQYSPGKDTTRTRNCFPFHSFTCTTNHHGRHGAQSNSTIACSTVELARYFCPRKNTSQYILAGTSASVLLVHSIDLPPLQLHNHSSRPSPIKTATLLRLWKLPSEHLKLVWWVLKIGHRHGRLGSCMLRDQNQETTAKHRKLLNVKPVSLNRWH